MKSSSTIQIYQKSETAKAEFTSLPLHNDIKGENNNKSNSYETPTPTISNPDIVRIYVPPSYDMLPADRNLPCQPADDEISECSNRSSIVHVEFETLPYDKSPENVKLQTIKQSVKKSHKENPKETYYSQQLIYSPGASKNIPQQYFYPNQPTININSQSSSSRRGSMSRKTPSPLIESELMIECDHMRIRKSHEHIFETNTNSMNHSISESTMSNNKLIHNNNTSINNNIIGSPMKRLTSFEELAKKSESNSLLYINEIDNNYQPSVNSKQKSDYNISYSYKNLEINASGDTDLDYTNIKHQLLIKKSRSHSNNFRQTLFDRKHSSSENNSPFDYDLLKEKRKDNSRFLYDYEESDGQQIETNENSIKSYNRFFNSDDEIDDEYDEIRQNRAIKKASSGNHHKHRTQYHVSGTEADDDENSSNSPQNKSISNTPVNESIPLLSYDAEQTVIYQSTVPPMPILPVSFKTCNSNSKREQQQRSKIPLRIGNSNTSLRKYSSISSPESDRSDGCQTTTNRHESKIAQSMTYQSSPTHSTTSSLNFSSAIVTPSSSLRQNSDNKICIKIKQNK